MSKTDESAARQERPAVDVAPGDGGDSACWANLVCPACGSMIEGECHTHGPEHELE
jgi:hypothetical protein